MLRLIAYAHDGVQRFPLGGGACVLGSEPGCDIYLPYTGVAKHHARISRLGEEVRIEDLGSRRGVLVNGRKVREAVLEVLDEIRLGTITLLLEDLQLEAERRRPRPAEPIAAVPVMDPQRMTQHLANVTDWVLADTESRTTLESVVRQILWDFGGGAIFLVHGDFEEAGVKFLVSTHADWLAEGEALWRQIDRDRSERARERGSFEGELGARRAWIFYRSFVALDRPYCLVVALPSFRAETWSPEASLGALGDLLILGLVHHVGRYEPILPGAGGQQDLTLAPGLVLGVSESMQTVVERLRALADPGVHILLLGEVGTGRELLARTLHLSGPHRHGPFVMASCIGAKPFQIEADLFGAEIPGKEGPLRREAKLLLADGGTLFLEEVDKLTLELQARLMRFVRLGEVEPPGAGPPQPASLRIIATARGPLEELVPRDLFRVDLAYRLSQFTIDVPSLRARREDLPLLIQWYINRFCHESGKRVQGITVKAMSALMAYDFPGNLPELENIVRQMVFLSPNGQPMDANLLPDEVRQSNVRSATRIDPASDLRLDRLVASMEETAIREAVRRSRGNKSRAAKLLGLSRNGLAMKMDRYGLG